MTKNTVRALYVQRGFSTASRMKRLTSLWGRSVTYTGQEGYFEAGLDAACEVSRVSSREFCENQQQLEESHDVLVINYKIDPVEELDRDQSVVVLAQRSALPKVLFVGTDRAADLPDDRVLNQFDIVYKRECYRDRTRYSVSEENQAKLTTTMLACPIFLSLRWLPFRFVDSLFPKRKKTPYKYDVFFVGKVPANNSVRSDVWRAVTRLSDSYRIFGGLLPSGGTEKEMIPPEMRGTALSRWRYARTLRRSKINLALDGIGEFTFRHHEIWYFGEFMISGPSIRDLDLPLPAREGVHYVAYDDLDDLREKIAYYTRNNEERERIARAGKEMFDTHYNPREHGKDIVSKIRSLV